MSRATSGEGAPNGAGTDSIAQWQPLPVVLAKTVQAIAGLQHVQLAGLKVAAPEVGADEGKAQAEVLKPAVHELTG